MVLLVEIIEVTAYLLHGQQGSTKFQRKVTSEDVHLDTMGDTHFLIDDLLLLSDIMKVKDGTDCMLNDIAEKQHTQEQQSENNEIQPRRITKDGFLGTGE